MTSMLTCFMRGFCLVFALAFAEQAVTVSQAQAAAAPIYVWYDHRAQMHATDRLEDVPEPYRAIFLARRSKQKPQAPLPCVEQTAAVGPPPLRHEDTIEGVRQSRAAWQERMVSWREELLAATARLKEVEGRVAQATANPLLRLTPAGRAKANESVQELADAQKRLLAARTMLLKTLPELARVQHVPPQWLF